MINLQDSGSSGTREVPPRDSRDATSRRDPQDGRTGRIPTRRCMVNPTTVDERTPEMVIGQLVGELGGSLGVLLTALGNRTGLWTALAGAGPLPAAELARRTNLNEALVREWCRAQAATGYLTYQPDGETFTLPDAVA